MRKIFILALMIVLLATAVMAQTPPPVNARASVDMNGTATVDWMAPFAADYFDDFEDGSAQGWVFDYPGDWTVEDGRLTSSWYAWGSSEGSWTSAYYGNQMYNNGIFELNFAKISGNPHYAMSMFLFTEGHYPQDTSNGYIFSMTPGYETGDYEGQYYVLKLIDGVAYYLNSWRYTPVINNGLDRFNTLSVAYEDDSIVFYINGHEVQHAYEPNAPTGYFGTGGAEDGSGFGHFGTIQWEFVGIDEYAGAGAESASIPQQMILPQSLIHENDLMRAPELSADQVHRTEAEIPLVAAGFFDPNSGTRELDEFLHYNVYRDGQLVGQPSEVTFSESLNDYGLHDYLVTAQYDEGESMSDSAGVLYKNPTNVVIAADFDNGLPADWSVETQDQDHTWHLDDGSEEALFDTPYMLVSDIGGGGTEHEERLVSPEFDVNEAGLVIIEFDHLFADLAAQYGHIQYQLNDGEWHPVYLYHDTMPDTGHAVWDFTEYMTGGSTARIGFLYDDYGDDDGLYWGIDNVSIYVQGGGAQQDFFFGLTPLQLVIQPEGGTIEYNAELINNTGMSAPNVRYRTYVDAPDGNTYGPLTNVIFNVTPFMTYSVMGLTQDIPGSAPGGTYYFHGVVGYNQGPQLSDDFSFLKLGLATDGEFEFDPSEWTSGGQFGVSADASGEVTNVVPSEFRLLNAYPNPFNPATTVRVSLPETADLSVTVYNVTGQRVADLAQGSYAAGTHRFTFDATNLASGLYFVRATVPGQLDQVQKVMLVR